MTGPRPGAVCVVLLIVRMSARAADRSVTVTTPDGASDGTARVACADPSSAAVAVDAQNRAPVEAGCRQVRCDSSRWLPGASIAGPSGRVTCALAPAVKLVVDLPRRAGGALVVSVRASPGRRPVFETTTSTAESTPRAPAVSPPIALGRYEISVSRPDGSWACRSSTRFTSPESVRVFAPWRDPVMLDGRIVSPAGRPLSDVRVTAWTDGAPGAAATAEPPRGRLEEWHCRAPDAEHRSGAEGTFRIAVDPEVETLVVAGGWDDPRGIDFVSRRGPRNERLRLVPAIPHRIVARVLDEAEHPVRCRARVEVPEPAERWAALISPGGAKDAACAPDGRLEAGPFRSDTFDLDVRSDEALPTRLSGTAPHDAPVKDLGLIRLERGATMRIVVVDADQAPVDGAAVKVLSHGGFILERTGRAGADGVAAISGLPREARVDVSVDAPGYAKATRTGVPPDDELRVSLDRTDVVRGRVRSPDGTSVRARVRATESDGSPLAETEADDSGSFSFPSLPRGVVRLQAVARGYRPSPPVGVTLAPGREPEPVVLVLGDPAQLRGTVFDPSRSPLPGAAVLLVVGGILFDPPGSQALAATRSAQDGSFTLDATEAADETIVAVAPGHAPAVRRVATLPDRGTVELVLGLEARLLARVPRSLPNDTPLLVSDGSAVARLVPLRSRDEVLVEGLNPGSGRASLGHGQDKPVRLIAGQTTSVDLSAGARVRARVTSQGRPRARAAVMIATTSVEGIETRVAAISGADGTAVFEAVGPGECLLVALVGDARAEKRIVVPPDGEIEVDLELVAHALRVDVRERGGAGAVAGATVTVTPRGATCTNFAEAGSVEDGMGWQVSISHSGCAQAVSGQDGSASFVLGASGPYVLSVQASGFAAWTGAVEIPEGSVEAVAELTRGGPPTVRVVIETDPPGIPGSIYCVQQANSGSHGPVAGEAVCEGLERGRAEVAFRAADYGLARTSVDVPESGETVVTLRVARGGTLIAPLGEAGVERIRVVDDHGVVWNGPYGQGWPRCGLESPGGFGTSYVCHDVPPGTYTVEIDGRRRPSVEVRSGGPTLSY